MQEFEIRPGRSLANYWDVVVSNWAIAWIRRDADSYRVKITGKIQGERDPLEMQSFPTLDVAAQTAVCAFRARFKV